MTFGVELAAALEAAKLATDFIRHEYEAFAAVPDAPANISTHVDRESQILILRHLHERFPSDALCAEESVPGFESVPKSARRAWVVDPIDGTRGFAKKTGQFSVMIGLLVDGVPVVGVVAEPAQHRVTYASKGCGCYSSTSNETITACHVSARTTGTQVLTQTWSKSGEVSRPVRLIEPAKVIETYSGGVKLALAARGEADVYPNVYETFYDWDICAGHVLVTEAGGVVTDLAGNPIVYQASDFSQRNGLLASNGIAHTDLVAALSRG